MSKKLFLVRHAKAEEIKSADSGKEDLKRDLIQIGITDAETMGKRLFSMQIKPEIIISSHAKRALQTAKIIAQELQFDSHKIDQNESLYGATAHSLLEVIGKTDDSIKSIMLVGHNPSFNELLESLCKTNIENIPKSGIVGVKLPVESWKGITVKCGSLLFFDSPKNK